jgi:hypothetical protein
VSGNYFDVLGVQPYLGRVFHTSDEHGANSAPYIVLSYASWHARFQDDRGVVGRTVQLNKHPFTIVGVAPPEFHGTLAFFNPDFFVPIVNQEQVDGESLLDTRGKRWVFMTLGHLKAGVTPAQATSDLNSIGSYLEKTYPKDDDQRSFTLARPGLYGDYLGKPVRAFMTALMLLAGLILLAACANLGSLFAARAADRSREVALRLALGATCARVLRQLFTEAVLLSLMGGAVGLLGSLVLLRGLSVWQPFSHSSAGEPGHKCVCGSFAAGSSQWISFWRRAGKASASHRPLRDRQVRNGGQGREEDYGPRRFAWNADCPLRRARHVVNGGHARIGTLVARQFRF